MLSVLGVIQVVVNQRFTILYVFFAKRQSIQLSDDMRDLISIHLMNSPVIHIGDLEHRVHPRVSRSSLTEHQLSHSPVIYFLLGHLLWNLHDHEIPRLNSEEWRGFRQVTGM